MNHTGIRPDRHRLQELYIRISCRMILSRVISQGFSRSTLKSLLLTPASTASRSTQFCAKMSASASGISSGKVEVNGVNLYYEQAGSGPEPVLLMPGALGCTQTDFKPQIEKLNRDLLTVIGFDPRGYGKSRPPDRDFPLDFFHRDAKDARDLMQALGHKKYSLMGWSDGGITALILAGTYTDEVKKLLVWGANSYVTQSDLKLYEATRDINNWSERMRAPMEAVYGKELFEKTWHGWCDALLKIGSQNDGDLCKEETKKIRCPTLIIHGDLDAMVVREHPEYLHNTIKGSKLIRWPKAKHNLHLRYSDEFNKEAEHFLSGATSVL